MVRTIAFLFFILPTELLFASRTVTIQVTDVPEQHRDEPFYITGIFNRWQPGEATARMQKSGSGEDCYEIVLRDIPDGLFEYKFTRGDWKTLEATARGRLVAPRSAQITADTVLVCTIPAWRDDFPASTASKNVHLIDSTFLFAGTEVNKKIWIYLPPGYDRNSKRYPVLYMHDGQDLFDEATSAGRLGPLEWGVDEMMDSVQNPCIVVALEHHPEKDGRLQEYFVHPNGEFSQVYGKPYLEWIVRDVKPYIDRHYRTLPGKNTTWMAGGSMGGLITLYAGLLYPHVFGALGVLSPSIWQDEGNTFRQIQNIQNRQAIAGQHYYFYAGDNENRIMPGGGRVQMHTDVKKAAALLQQKARPSLQVTIQPAGRHGAWYWRLAFPAFYEWIAQFSTF